jgi:peptidyl-prolyl cis-trans isomerase SurA
MTKHRQTGNLALTALLAVCLGARTLAQTPQTTAPATPVPPSDASSASAEKPLLLDRVIAIVNGDVLLESDVLQEMRIAALQPITVPAAQNTKQRAAQRLIARSLILRQMREQHQIDYAVTDDEVRKSLLELRKDIPICRKMSCATEDGWKAFLKVNDITEQEAEERWRQRLQIMKFIDARFGATIRIQRQDIQKYYQATVVPAFDKMKESPPSLESTTPRIREILLQQQVNSLLRDWLQSLREQGSVQILDPTYGQSTSNSGEDEGGGK